MFKNENNEIGKLEKDKPDIWESLYGGSIMYRAEGGYSTVNLELNSLGRNLNRVKCF